MELKDTEISQKLCEAIKKKLIDLQVYVDDELPDYIMVMVANKKSEAQMTEDLNLFLSNNTLEFTSWLHNLLCRLKNVPSEEIDTFLEAATCTNDGNDLNENKTSLRSDELTLLMDENDEFDTEERSQSSVLEMDKHITHNEAYIPCSLQSGDTSDESSYEIPVYTPTRISKLNERNSSRKRKIPESVVGAVVEKDINEEEDDYDPLYPLIGSVASTVKTIRKPSVPPSKQASRSLIMRAVSEAQESVEKYAKNISGKKIERAIVRPLSRRSIEKQCIEEKVQQALYAAIGSSDQPSFKKQKLIHEISQDLSDVKKSGLVLISKSRRDELAFQLHHSKENVDTVSKRHFEEESNNNQKNILMKDPIISMSEQNPPDSPKFIVTLDGVTKYPVIDSRNVMFVQPSPKVIDQSLSEIENVEKKHSSTDEDECENKLVRCKFWPTCKVGPSCEYHHPKSQCRSFPNCKFGEKCLNIHPNCKFDAKCTNVDCPYSHASLKKYKESIKPPSKVFASLKSFPFVKKPTESSVCKYFPSCTNHACPFLHPKPCRYGMACSKKEFCPFFHPPAIPSREKLKWTSKSTR